MSGKVLHLDFETFARYRNLKTVGVYEYVQDPDFEITVIAWAWDDGPVQSIRWPATATIPREIEDHVNMGGKIHAWNAAFERAVLEAVGLTTYPEQFVCTMQRSLAWGLPGALEEAGPALGLKIVKDPTARSLMLSMGKPRANGSRWYAPFQGSKPADLRDCAQRLLDLEAYCRRDVEAERELGKALPFLTEFETRVSLIDARSNDLGVRVDDNAIRLLALAREEMRAKTRIEVRDLTDGYVDWVDTQSSRLQAWLQAQGVVDATSVGKESVERMLGDMLPGKARRVLELREAFTKSSLGKLEAMLSVRGADGRARGLLQYYGAGRTGRWAGRLIQVQNLPRVPAGFDADGVLGLLETGEPDALELFYAGGLEVLSSCLRACLTAAPGFLLAMIDLSQIEARVLAWLAGQEDVLDVFRRGEDVYTFAAAKLGSSNRQLGKVVTLACGYGMGAGRLQETALTYGVTLTPGEAEDAKAGWRRANPAIVRFWYDIDTAARAAIARPGVVVQVRGIKLRVRGGVLFVRKPSGGVLVYHGARIGALDGSLEFDGVHQTTKRWSPQRTYGGKLVENLTQAVARDVMAEAMVRVSDWTGMIPVMTVHDELVYEVDGGWRRPEREAEALQRVVDTPPPWAGNLPVASKLHVGFRYGK